MDTATGARSSGMAVNVVDAARHRWRLDYGHTGRRFPPCAGEAVMRSGGRRGDFGTGRAKTTAYDCAGTTRKGRDDGKYVQKSATELFSDGRRYGSDRSHGIRGAVAERGG